MIYGDEPQKWNEWQGEEDALGLHAYTYKPETTAVAQAGNLYGYAVGNPVCWSDPTGQTVWGEGVSGSASFGAGTSGGILHLWDSEGNEAYIVTGYYGGGTPNASASVNGIVSSASNIFEHVNGFTGVIGGSAGPVSFEMFLGTETDGSGFGGGMLGGGVSVFPIEMHAGGSYAVLTNIIKYQGEPVPQNVTLDYFYTLNPTLKDKVKKDLSIPIGYRSNSNRNKEERMRDSY